ncbi:MAG TPA: tetratricopeptide repeat protein [Thermoanaerobaculia bacterium]|nr:tetratricopeptide repeat protein [Thermoanaerobaculia bacterium]
MATHPTREEIERFLEGGLSEEESERIAGHLVTERCLPCLFVARNLMAETEPAVRENLRRLTRPEIRDEDEKDERFDLAITQAQRRSQVIAAERALAPELLAELERRSPVAARDAIRTAERYQLFGLSEHLIDQSREQGFRNVALALELAELAVEVSDSLDPRIYMAVTTADQRALSRAALGNARRIASDLFGAERAFQESLPILKEGNRTSPVPADVWSLLASLRIDQGRYREARQLLDRSLAIYRQFRSKRDEGKVLMQLANAEGYSGNPEAAVEILHRAVGVLDKAGEKRLLFWAHLNLFDWMVEAGQALEALARYEKSRDLYDEHGTEPSIRLRQRWLEGRIYAGLEDFNLARKKFEEVRATAIERGLSYEVAMVSLELALVHLRLGDVARVQDLAEEITPLLRSHELHRHALAAMYLFRDRARTERATVGFLQEILRYLRRARNNPFLRFEPSARWG